MHTEYPPLTQGSAVIRGVVAGGLVGAGLVAPFGDAGRAALLIVGLFVFVDSCLPQQGKGFYTLSMVAAALFGGIAGAVIVLVGGDLIVIPLGLAAAYFILRRLIG